jgi:mRNA interferase RelE/StbE
LAWTIDYSDMAERQLNGLDRQVANRIRSYMSERVATLDDPPDRGERLSWNLRDRWRYRVGDYRVICDIQDDALVVLVFAVGHRREIYS